MKIVLIGPAAPPAGGMANQTAQLHRLLAESGVDVTFVQTNPAYCPAFVAGIPVIRALARIIPYVIRLERVCRTKPCLHIMANSGWSWHLFAAPAIVIGRLHKCRVIVNYRGGYLKQFLERQQRFVLPLIRMASAIIVPSDYLRCVFDDFQISSDVIPNVIDTQTFRPSDRKTGGVETIVAPHVVVTRNLEEIYDIPTAIRAFQKIHQEFPTARLTVAGSGPALSALERLVSEVKLDEAVEFVGRLSVNDIADLYAKADLMLNPSRVDNMPNSILEAFASGLPVVSTNVGGIPYIARAGIDAALVCSGR